MKGDDMKKFLCKNSCQSHVLRIKIFFVVYCDMNIYSNNMTTIKSENNIRKSGNNCKCGMLSEFAGIDTIYN